MDRRVKSPSGSLSAPVLNRPLGKAFLLLWLEQEPSCTSLAVTHLNSIPDQGAAAPPAQLTHFTVSSVCPRVLLALGFALGFWFEDVREIRNRKVMLAIAAKAILVLTQNKYPVSRVHTLQPEGFEPLDHFPPGNTAENKAVILQTQIFPGSPVSPRSELKVIFSC